MWPFRPERLTDVLPRDDIRQLLALGASAGTTLVLVARAGEDSFETFRAEASEAERRPDPFCDYFRRGQHGSGPAFAGADEACARSEERFVRRLFPPPGAAPLVLDDSGTAKHRCHMGLTDYLVPVEVGGRALGALVGGRRVEAEEDRLRIRKSVGKLGKLTRAEAESSGDQPPIVPADEKARDRLLHEIQAIPAASPEFVGKLKRIGELFGRIATARFDALRWVREDPVLDAIAAQDGGLVASPADLRRDLEGVLARLREELALEHLALFAPAAGDAGGADALLPLVAASGLAVDPGRRLLEIDWAKLPPPQPDPSREFFRGVQAASSAARVFAAADVPKWLKETIARSAFLYPVERAPTQRAVVLFGPAKSSVPPEDADYRFLERIARALAHRYYARAAEAERHGAVEQLARIQDAARAAEEARKAAEEKLREEEERRKLEERTRGFIHFNFSKLVEQCVAAVAPKAGELGIEFDARAVPERLMYDGDRRRLGRAIEEILFRCVARTRTDPPSAKPAPVRVFLRRGRNSISFGAEAVGEYVTREERRQLFARATLAPGGAPGAGGATAGSGEAPGEAAPPEEAKAEVPPEVPSTEVPPQSPGAETPPTAPGAGLLAAVPAEPSPTEPASEAEAAPRADAARRAEDLFRLPATLGEVLAVVRRHGGRLRVDSERLRRLTSDPRQWMARTTFLVELPLWSPGSQGQS